MPKKGYKHSDETRRKMSENHKGMKLSEESKKKISKTHKERFDRLGYINSPEVRKKISETMKRNKIGFQKGHHSKTEFKKGCKKPLKSHKYVKGETSGEKNPSWQGGISYEPYSIDWTDDLKRAIRKRDRYTCQLCGKEPSTHCHHIDYDKKNCNPDNLVTLCVSCHGKTQTDRNYWLNYFKNL